MEIICVQRCKNQNKIMRRNTALKLTFRYFYAIIAIKHVLLCIQHSLGSSGVVENLPRNPVNVNARKNMFDPYYEMHS